MTDHVLSARVYFADADTATNAHAHLVALMDQARAEGRVVGDRLDASWVRTHECHAHEDAGHTDRCQTIAVDVRQPSGDDGEPWQTGVDYAAGDVVTYDAAAYECLQAHTSQAGWEPDAAASLWQAV